MPLQQILPTWLALNAANDASASGLVNIRTGDPVFAGGLNLGDYFDTTEKEANTASYTTNGILHAGRYRRVQLHSGATVANQGIGKLGCMVTSLIPELNIVTTTDVGVTGSVRIVVFLNVVTPGNFCFVQELGIANCLASGAAAVGGPVGIASATGTVIAAGTNPSIGQFLDVAANGVVGRVALFLPTFQG